MEDLGEDLGEDAHAGQPPPPRSPRVCVGFHDAVLYEGDVEILRSTSWLNDHCVLFWQQVLEHERFKELAGQAVILQPAAAFSMQFLDAEDLAVDTPGNVFRLLGSARLVLAPTVVDADAEGGGGSHWVLVAWNRSDPSVVGVVDSALSGSAGGAVPAAARDVAAKLGELLGLAEAPRLATVRCPQQSNGFDCGVHVCANAEAVLMALRGAMEQGLGLDLGRVAWPTDMAAKRLEMYETALQLAARAGAGP